MLRERERVCVCLCVCLSKTAMRRPSKRLGVGEETSLAGAGDRRSPLFSPSLARSLSLHCLSRLAYPFIVRLLFRTESTCPSTTPPRRCRPRLRGNCGCNSAMLLQYC